MVSGTSPVVTGPECIRMMTVDELEREVRFLGLQKSVTPTFPNPSVQSYHTESVLWSYREQQ